MRIARPAHTAFILILAGIIGAGVGLITWQVGATIWPGVILFLVLAGKGMARSVRRWRLAKRPFPESWRVWLGENVPLYRRLDDQARDRFEMDVRFVMAEWRFEGVDGVDVSEELKLSVAAGAALLLHGRPDWEIRPARTILFYPEQFDDRYHVDDDANYDGMAHAQGPVILSRKAVLESWASPRRGSNVVLHELAHLLDFANEFADGVTPLVDPGSIDAWNRLVRSEMNRIRFGRSLLRQYGAQNQAEFFAVAIENFFDRPDVLARRHPELFEALRELLNLDPRSPAAEAE